MTAKRGHPKKTGPDQRQLELLPIDEPTEDEAVAAFYRRLRRSGVTLRLDISDNIITATRKTLGVPSWWAPTARRYFERIKADLLRVEHGIVPEIERERLDGGAVLVRLPGRKGSPELNPPVAYPHKSAPRVRHDGGAA
jgi:hypothetical protein